jgi:DEAD/DEAH box helicase
MYTDTTTVTAILNRARQADPSSSGHAAVYIAPLKALARERLRDWKEKFGRRLGLTVLEFTGDAAPDAAALRRADIIITTPEKWDGVTRGWKSRPYVSTTCSSTSSNSSNSAAVAVDTRVLAACDSSRGAYTCSMFSALMPCHVSCACLCASLLTLLGMLSLRACRHSHRLHELLCSSWTRLTDYLIALHMLMRTICIALFLDNSSKR